MKRLRRLSGRKKRLAARRRPINVLASVLTTFGLYCGIASIFETIRLDYKSASYLILIAIVFDMFDGTVAKITHSASEFGKQLDSLCDLVSFGVAPAVLIYRAYLHEAPETLTGRLCAVVAVAFAICAALRLARFNVYQSEMRDYFVGLPTPMAGGTVASFVLFTEGGDVAFWVMAPMTVGLSYLMVSNVRYPKDKLRVFVLAPRSAFRILAFCVIGIAVFHYARSHSLNLVLLPLAVVYVLFGIGDDVYARWRRRTVPQVQQAAADPAARPERQGASEPPAS